VRGSRDPHRFSVAEAIDLWAAYTNWQRGQLAKSTIANDYKRVAAQLDKIPRSITLTTNLIDWCLLNWSPEVTRRLQQQLTACYRWAVLGARTKTNPFIGLPILAPTKGAKRFKAFTPQDRETILAAFKRDAPQYSNWVEFLFRVGCRPSEAAALTWRQIGPDRDSICIDAAYLASHGIRQETKTHSERIIHCGPELKKLLNKIHRTRSQSSDLVFFSRSGRRVTPLNPNNFQRRWWNPIVTALAEAGEISCYLPQKNCRHTLATELLQSGVDVKTASGLLGNHPEVFLGSYAEQARILSLPDMARPPHELGGKVQDRGSWNDARNRT
jgi:integrase